MRDDTLSSANDNCLNMACMDQHVSPLIYKELLAGRMINHFEWAEGKLQPALLFREIIHNLDTYRYFYKLIGFELKNLEDVAFYIVKINTDENSNATAMDIQVLITLICRGLTLTGSSAEALVKEYGGVSEATINVIGELAELQSTLKGCKITLPLWKSVQSVLIDRNVGYLNLKGDLLLTSSGQVMFEQLYGVDLRIASRPKTDTL